MAINNENPTPAGCSPPLKGCLVTTVIVMALFLGVLAYFSRMPSVRAMGVCKYNMQELAAAIDRYKAVNGHRPESLDELADQYLKDPSVLRCPLDKSSGDTSSYTYNPKAGDNQIMLECARYKLRHDMPNSILRVSGDGRFDVRNPGIKETIRDAEKRSKQ